MTAHSTARRVPVNTGFYLHMSSSMTPLTACLLPAAAGAGRYPCACYSRPACYSLTHALLLPARVSALLAVSTSGRGLLRRSHDSSSSSPGTSPCLLAARDSRATTTCAEDRTASGARFSALSTVVMERRSLCCCSFSMPCPPQHPIVSGACATQHEPVCSLSARAQPSSGLLFYLACQLNLID